MSERGAETEMPQLSIIGDLVDVIADRKAHPPAEGSYVVQLLQAGARKIRVKVIEEAAEVFEAAAESRSRGRSHRVKERSPTWSSTRPRPRSENPEHRLERSRARARQTVWDQRDCRKGVASRKHIMFP